MTGPRATPPPAAADEVPRVLVVDDERPLTRLVGTYLERGGFEVVLAFDGLSAVEAVRSVGPDVIVLDLGLPGLDGVEVCRRVRTFSDCYVVMLTARSEEVDKLVGLSVGADDYVTKPFSPRELVARVQAMLRRPRGRDAAPAPDAPSGRGGHHQVLVIGSLSLDVQAREVRVDGVPIELTRTEFDVLAVLAARPRLAFTRRRLIDAVWGPDWVADEHLVDVHVGHLRRKLGDDANAARFIRTVRGIGYRMGEGR
ncbi:MAG TPA: response regulator transcription factor [Kineosporiaceae bacterium]